MLGTVRVALGRHASGLVCGLACGVLASSFFQTAGTETSAKPKAGAAPLLSASETVVGEPITYPAGSNAKVTVAVVSLAPGQETGWHTHGSPVVGYVLEGVLDVDYGPKGVRTYRAGEAVLEAISVPHNGRNPGPDAMRILAVFVGAEGLATSAAASAPK